MKKKTFNKTLLYIGIGVIVYLVLLFLLIRVESASPDSGIRSFPAGLWYTITTLTTVGYGDLYPVTAAGKAIGVIFQLMSLGVLVGLLSLALSFIKGKFLPRQKLRFNRSKDWYIFEERSKYTESLAESLEREYPDSCVIFSEPGGIAEGGPGLGIELSLPEILALKKKQKNKSLFFLSEDILDNEQKALSFKNSGAEVYCLTVHEPETMPLNIHVFDPYKSIARLFWSKYPLVSSGEKIVVIGDGKAAYSLLEEGLIVNVIDPGQHITYHLFGNYDEFLRLHPYMDRILSIGKPDPSRDSLLPDDGPWSADFDLLESADRIIVCSDSEEENISALISLTKYCPYKGKIYAKLSMPFDGAETFGSCQEIFSPEYILRNELSRFAIRLHEMYQENSPGKYPEWNELGRFLRRSNLASADHLLTKIRVLLGPEAGNRVTPELCLKAFEAYKKQTPEEKDLLRNIEHDRWVRFHTMSNWQFGEIRDNTSRLHPLLLPYAELSETEREKDDYGWQLLEELGNLLQNKGSD